MLERRNQIEMGRAHATHPPNAVQHLRFLVSLDCLAQRRWNQSSSTDKELVVGQYPAFFLISNVLDIIDRDRSQLNELVD